MSFQVRKAHLDFLALIARSSKFGGTRKGAGIIAGFFVDVACDLPERCAGASFLEFANAAVSWVGQIIPGSAIMDGSRGPQKPTVRTDIDVARSVVSEIEAREHAVSSLVSFLHRNMRGDVLVEEPSEQLACPIRGIGREPSGL
jgi:hypothetical protein